MTENQELSNRKEGVANKKENAKTFFKIKDAFNYLSEIKPDASKGIYLDYKKAGKVLIEDIRQEKIKSIQNSALCFGIILFSSWVSSNFAIIKYPNLFRNRQNIGVRYFLFGSNLLLCLGNYYFYKYRMNQFYKLMDSRYSFQDVT